MGIEWGTRARTLRLGYLFRGEYHDQTGTRREVHWCGPRSRVGSGLNVPEPAHPLWGPAQQAVSWQARMDGCSLDIGLGAFDQPLPTIGDMTFGVNLEGGPHADPGEDEVGHLLRDAITGRWRNNHATLWAVDLDTGDHQVLADGFFDRNPTSVTPSGFKITVASGLFAGSEPWPGERVPATTVGWLPFPNVHTPYAGPTQYALSPHHIGRVVSSSWGTGGSGAGVLGAWKELVPFGRTPVTGSHFYIYCWVTPHLNAFVNQIYRERGDSTTEPLPGAEETYSGTPQDLMSYNNTDPNHGPLGTCARFKVSATSHTFIWYGSPYPRVWGTVMSADGGVPTTQLDGVWYLAPSLPLVNNRVTDVLAEVEATAGIPLWAAGSLAAYDATSNPPLCSDRVTATVPQELEVHPPTLRVMLGDLAQAFNMDIVERYDSTVSAWRLAPVKRPSLSAQPDHVIGPEDLLSDPPRLTQDDDPDGCYANDVSVIYPPVHEPIVDDIRRLGSEQIYRVTSTSEMAPAREGMVVPAEREIKTWHHGTFSDDERWAQQALGAEQAQPQRSIVAAHGVRSFSIQLGELLAYTRIPGVNPGTGQVRHMTFDYDEQTVEITTALVDHKTGRGEPGGERDPDDWEHRAPIGPEIAKGVEG